MPSPDLAQSALSPVDEELIAYLDDQLSAAERARVESRLAEDEAYRLRLALLERSWEMLDILPRPEPQADFARSTVEMTAVRAQADLEQKKVRQFRASRLRFWFLGVAAIAATAAGFAGVLMVLTAEDRRLVRDLPVIERVEEYRSVDNVEFLKMLEKAGLFAEESGDAI